MKKILSFAVLSSAFALVNSSCERQKYSDTKHYHSRMGEDAHGAGGKTEEHAPASQAEHKPAAAGNKPAADAQKPAAPGSENSH